MYVMKFCKVVPDDYLKFMTDNQDNNDVITNYSINYAAKLITDLLTDEEVSIPGVHVYSFNNFNLMKDVFDKLDFEKLGLITGDVAE